MRSNAATEREVLSDPQRARLSVVGFSRRRPFLNDVRAIIFVTAFLCFAGGRALAVVGGKTVNISAAPWSVVVWARSPYAGMPKYAACTGVIVDARHVLTAEHCVMRGGSAQPNPASHFTIEAGASNFDHPLASDHPQVRAVSAEWLMPGYIALNKRDLGNAAQAAGHDLAVFKLSRPLDLGGADAKAANLPRANMPEPSASTRLVMAGYGDEKVNVYPNGGLNELIKATVVRSCSTDGALCVITHPGTCLGDSGSGLVEPGKHPTVVGVLSGGAPNCSASADGFDSLTAQASLQFIKSAIN